MPTLQILKEAKIVFEEKKHIYESVLLTFKGVDGWDVYNCSVPFFWKGKKHMYGRVEKRSEWASSHVRLFVETGKDEFTVLPEGMTWLLEDPFIQKINDMPIFGGTRIRKSVGRVVSCYCDFYKGDPEIGYYFTTGPDNMKDVRLVQMQDGRIGIFTRSNTDIYPWIGFTIIDRIEGFTPKAIESAEPFDVMHPGVMGGVSQAFQLSSGKIGCIARCHYDSKDNNDKALSVCVNYSFVLDPETREVDLERIIATRACFPPCPTKSEHLVEYVFSSGIVMRDDGKCDLYSGICDTSQGRVTIDYPFEGYGEIVGDLNF
ncbi:unnamed protein product [Phytomonas sp. EM1]|nr:unnamed protein product [Phytomonas sp. EM1]|eukprot:CCW63538.1 unnamed protein product [Phytomonas sp. isolate EM1]